MSSYTYTSKFFSLAPYLLMEYRYGSTPNPEYHPTIYGTNPVSVGFEKIVNGYLDNSVQILNRNNDAITTGNVRDLSSVQISKNTFVRLDIDRILQFLDYDNKLTDVANLPVVFESNLNVYYDTIRYHFLSGFDFGLSDGVVLQVQFQERNGKRCTVSQITYEKGDINISRPNPNPIYFNAGIYDNFIEVKIPSYSSITYEFDTQINTPTINQTVAAKLSSDGQGFIRNQPFYVNLYRIETTQELNSFFYYNTQLNSTATVTPFDEYSDLAANIVENPTFDYFEYYPTWQGNFIEDFLYTENSLGRIYYVIHDIELREQVGLRQISTQKIQVLQDKDFNSPYIYRPVVLNPKATSFTISYILRLVDKFSNVSILRSATLTSTEVDKYGPGLKRINLLNQPYPQKVYNKVVEPVVSKAYTLNVNPIERVITKYVPAFFERESVNISEEDLTIDNLGGLTQSPTKDATIAFGQGNARIVVNPYDNYYKFRIFTKNDGKENTILDLGNNTEFFLVFEGGDNKTVKIASMADSTFQNPNRGELVFRVVEGDSKKISAFSKRDFHIVSRTNNGIETSVYHGYWILPNEREQKPSSTTPSTPTPPPPSVVIGGNSDSSSPTVDIIPEQPKDYFDPISNPVLLDIEPTITSTPTVSVDSSNSVSVNSSPISGDIDSLANAIRTDEEVGKTVQEISDYYTVPGNPGNSLFEGITVRYFLNAVRLVHPDVSGVRSPRFLAYSNYLGEIYQPYENARYAGGGSGESESQYGYGYGTRDNNGFINQIFV